MGQAIEAGRLRYGGQFDPADMLAVDPLILQAYETQRRVRVRFSYGEVATGTIGKTTGWRPVLLLMRRRTDLGSSYVIGPRDRVTAIQYRRTYEPVEET
jgi:hypothetical protein